MNVGLTSTFLYETKRGEPESKDTKESRPSADCDPVMIELELDFSGEDVTFASRDELKSLLDKIKQSIKELLDSFAYGNAIKQGVSVALLGAPNVGKSTLLNALLNEERAIVNLNGLLGEVALNHGIELTDGVNISTTNKVSEDGRLILLTSEGKVE